MNGLSKSIVLRGVLGVLAVALGGCATGASGGSPTPQERERIAQAQCAGLPAREQQLGLLAYRDAIAGARPYEEEYQVGKMKITRDRGVQLSIRAQPAMTVPWLERVASCHMTLAGSPGRIASSGSDPLLVPGATVQVDAGYTDFIVRIRVPDADAAAEVMRRTAVVMATPSGPAMTEVAKR